MGALYSGLETSVSNAQGLAAPSIHRDSWVSSLASRSRSQHMQAKEQREAMEFYMAFAFRKKEVRPDSKCRHDLFGSV